MLNLLTGEEEVEERVYAGRNMNDEYYTPPWLIAKVKRVLGEIDLDPASCPEANVGSTINAKTIYTKSMNGLERPWFGTVFVNPPYSAALINRFIEKAVMEYESGRVKEMIILTNSSTDSNWNFKMSHFTQAYSKGRVSFLDQKTMQPKGTGSRGQLCTYFGNNVSDFVAEFISDDTFWVPNLTLTGYK